MSRPEKRNTGGFLELFKARKGGNMPRPKSETDFSEVVAEQESFIEHLDEEALNSKFEEMLNDMNLNEEKKEPLRSQPSMNKKKMLVMHYKGATLSETRSKFDKPADYIQYLSQPDLSVNKIYNCIESLRIALTNNTLSWVQEFGTKGLAELLKQLNECYTRNDSRYDRIQYECLRCIKAIMNNTVGIKQVFSRKEALTIVARSLNPSKELVMLEALRVLAAVCLIEPDGHQRVVYAITESGEMKNTMSRDVTARDRFGPVVRGLMNTTNEPLRVACLTLINAIVSIPEDLDFRQHLRNEISRTGLGDMLEGLDKDASKDLAIQLACFRDHKDDDYHELMQRFDNVRMELDDINDCYEIIKNLVMDSPAEPYLLSIFQHLLFIRDDALYRPAYYKLIEECVSQIVLQRSGCDPDFATKRFHIDVQPLIDGLVEKSRSEDERRVEEMSRKVEEALALRHEAEAKIVVLETRIAQMHQGGGGGGKLGPPPPPMPGMMGMMGPPPPPMPGGVALPGMMGPPPPPMPGMGGMGPPPPPMPGMGGMGPPPPPMMPGMGGPPPPPFPGMGPPPPPMMGGFMMPPAPRPDVLPHGLKPKKKWETDGPLKRANWKAIIPQKMSEKSFWVRVREEKHADPDILSGLSTKFSSKPASKKVDDHVDRASSKKVKDLKVLDGKAAQNISILLGGALKHLTYQQVKASILRCDDGVLSDNVLEQLVNYLPPPDQLRKLEEFRSQYDELTDAEQFAVTLAEIKRLLPRLKSIKFKLRQSEMVQDIKPDIVSGAAACEEVKQSKKFAQILELILLVGNYMNSGSKNGQAFGFEISFLPKLTSTKDIENKTTLLHYLVDIIEKKFPDLLTFHEELGHVDKASRVSVDSIQKILRVMDSDIKNLETDLANSKVPQGPDDKFTEVMGSFAVEAREQCGILQNMFKNMESLYTELADYYAFDKQKYSLEEFFGDVKTFKDAFMQAHKDNVKVRETEEKIRRAQEAREKADVERADRAARKRALVDMNCAETQEGVMDSLLEALQTGSAFGRDQRAKRNRPQKVGAERRAQLNRSRSRTGLAVGALTGRELSNEILGT